MTDFLEDDDDNEETEVERPKTPPKPREIIQQPKPEMPVVLDVPETPSARRGDSGGSGPLVPPMADYVEPQQVQSQNDREVSDAFKQHPRMGKVIPIRPGTTPGAAPSRPSPAPEATRTGPTPSARPAPSTGPVAAPSRAVQNAQRAAYEAQVQARRAAEVEARAFAEADALDPEPEPEGPRRIPVQRKTKSFVLLGVAAAALFGAVAFSMWETYSAPPPDEEEDEEEEEEDEIQIEPISLDTPDDVIEGEIVEDEPEKEDEEVA